MNKSQRAEKMKIDTWTVSIVVGTLILGAIWLGSVLVGSGIGVGSKANQDNDQTIRQSCVAMMEAFEIEGPINLGIPDFDADKDRGILDIKDSANNGYLCIYRVGHGVTSLSSDKRAKYEMRRIEPTGNRFATSQEAYIYAINLLEPMVGGHPYVERKFEYRPHVFNSDGTVEIGTIELTLTQTHLGYKIIGGHFSLVLDPADGGLLSYSGGDRWPTDFRPVPNRILTEDEAITAMRAERGRQTTAADLANFKATHKATLLWRDIDDDRTTEVVSLQWWFESDSGGTAVDADTGRIVGVWAKKG